MPGVREITSLQLIAVMAIPLVFAIVLHEVAHGWVARLKGDDTAYRMGRLTLNPLAHIDPFGTVLLPIVFFLSTGMLFAIAKPVPVNFMNLRRPKEDMVWVAAAGPVTNMVLAVVSAVAISLLKLFSSDVEIYLAYIPQGLMPADASMLLFPIVGMLWFSVVLNVVLAIINLIPIPPADGGRITVGLLPHKHAAAYSRIEPIGIFIIIFIVMFNPMGITHRVIWPLIMFFVKLLVY
jgi:Zn-dependent protease